MDRLARKFETARKFVPKPEVEKVQDAKIGIIAFGTTHWAITESRDQLREEMDVKTSYYRLRAYPFNDSLLGVHRPARTPLCRRAEPRRAAAPADEARTLAGTQAKLRSVLHYSGLPIDARSVTDDILSQEGFEVAKKTVRHRRRQASTA